MLVNFISKNTQNIFEKKQHAVLGISPFNSYFNTDTITKLITFAVGFFNSINIFIPDTLSIYNFLELGYSYEKACYKSRRQVNYLKNKVKKVLDSIGYDEELNQIIIDMSYLENNLKYQESLEEIYYLYNNDIEFNNKCMNTTRWILKEYFAMEEHKINKIAVHYLLRELPIFLQSPDILGVSSSVFIYHQTPEILVDLFNNKLNLLPNYKQGFLELDFTDTDIYNELNIIKMCE